MKGKVSVGGVQKPKVRGTRANSPTRFSCTVIFDITKFSPDTTVFRTRKLVLRTNDLDIAALSYVGIEMAIAIYHFLRELIYHFFGTDLLRSIFGLFLSVSFEKLSSWCCNNATVIALLLVAGEHLSRYRDVTLTLYIVRNVNVNVKNDFCFTLSCELVA